MAAGCDPLDEMTGDGGDLPFSSLHRKTRNHPLVEQLHKFRVSQMTFQISQWLPLGPFSKGGKKRGTIPHLNLCLAQPAGAEIGFTAKSRQRPRAPFRHGQMPPKEKEGACKH